MSTIRRLLQHVDDPELARALFPIAFAICALGAVLLFGAGCSIRATNLKARTSFTVAKDPELEAYCARLNRRYIGFTATAVGLGAAGAATGIPAMLTSDTPRWATGATAAVTSIGAAIFTTLSNLEASTYTRDCTVGTTGAP